MDYKRADDPLFGKYCYIDTPWIAGKHTIYRIIRSGVHSNSWCEVPVNGQTEKVNHGEHSEEIVFVVLDTLIDEDTKIMRFALKDVEIIEMADRKTEPTISKMEQVDRDTNARSKDEPNCEECKHFHENAVMYLDQCDFCFKDCKFEPKDEPTTQTETQNSNSSFEKQTDCAWK